MKTTDSIDLFMFWDDEEPPTHYEKLEEKQELKDLQRLMDIRGDKMSYG